MKRKLIVDILCYLFIVLFVYASTTKLLDHQLFEIQISLNTYLRPFATALSILLPLAELAIAIMLAIGRFRLWGLYAFTGLMFIFTIYIVIIINFSEKLPCSCGGILQRMHWKDHLIFNIVFVALGIIAIYLHRKNNKEATPPAGGIFNNLKSQLS